MRATDQLGRTIEFNFPPKRIVTLVPSQSELLWALGLREEIVGITKFCIHPETMFRSVTRVGGTKEVKPDVIDKLRPDLIIANKEENERGQIERLAEKHPVWVSDIYNLADACKMMEQVGEITDRKKEAAELVEAVRSRYEEFRIKNSELRISGSVAYLIWKNPYMAAGGRTFIDFMLNECGLKNVFAGERSRYPEVTAQMLADLQPGFVFLSSEPYPFKEKHVEELRRHLPQSKIILVDGEMFSWYGSRLRGAFPYLSSLLKQLRAS